MFRTDRGDRPNAPNYLIVFTDGRSDDQSATWREAKLARDAGIHVTTVGISTGVDKVIMSQIMIPPN